MKYILSLLAFVLPFVALGADKAATIDDGIKTIGDIVALIIPIAIGIALITFIWGVMKYMIAKDEDSQKEARSVMLWGIIGLFVIVSVWGIVGLIGETFGITDNTIEDIPTVPGLGDSDD